MSKPASSPQPSAEGESPSQLIDAKIKSLDGKVRRAIVLQEGDEIDEAAFKALIRAAAALNKPQS